MIDLTERLRSYLVHGGVYRDDDEKLIAEAADEIELLRADARRY